MAGNIKGITIEIGGDVQPLNKALGEVNKKSRDMQGELRQVEKLLKLDPKNTTLLAQRQEILTKAISNTSDKLETLKEAQRQVQAQFERGEIGVEQYRALQREVISTEQELRRLESRTVTLASRMREAGESMGKVGEKVKGAGEKLSMGVTAPIVATGAVILKGAVDAENAQGKLQASLGLTAEEADKLGAVAKSVWQDAFGENIGEVNDAVATIRKNMGKLPDEELKRVTEGAMTIADVFGAEVTDSSKAAGTMMKNFGISGQEALDLITVGFQKGGDYSGELLDTMNEYSPQFKSMGLSADQMMGILIAGAQAGSFNLDKVGDAMKEFNLRAQDGSKTTADGFKAIGLDANKMGAEIAKGGEDGQKAFTATVAALAAMKDPLQQNAAGVALFGPQWEDVRSKVIVAMADGMKGIGEFKGATDKAASAMYDNNPASALTSAMRSLQGAIGPALLPLADIITKNVVPAIKKLTDWFVNLSPEGQKTALTILGIAAAIGPALVIIGSLITNVGKIVTTFSKASTAIGEAGGIMKFLTSPVGIAILAIIALIAIGVLLYQNWDTVTQTLSEAWTNIKNTFIGGTNVVIDLLNKLRGAMGLPMIAKIGFDVANNSTADGMRAGRNANGTDYWRGGLTWVGERGAELINLPRGSQVYSNRESMAMANSTVNHTGTIRVEGVNDQGQIQGVVDIIVNRLQMEARMA